VSYDIVIKKGAGHVLMRLDEVLEMPRPELLRLVLERKAVFVRSGKIVPATAALRDIRLTQWNLRAT
jgi:hypothetical protein